MVWYGLRDDTRVVDMENVMEWLITYLQHIMLWDDTSADVGFTLKIHTSIYIRQEFDIWYTNKVVSNMQDSTYQFEICGKYGVCCDYYIYLEIFTFHIHY